jgi:hypothetical protein
VPVRPSAGAAQCRCGPVPVRPSAGAAQCRCGPVPVRPAQAMPSLCREGTSHRPGAQPRYSRGTPRVLQGYSRGTPRVLPGYSRGTPGAHPRHCRYSDPTLSASEAEEAPLVNLRGCRGLARDTAEPADGCARRNSSMYWRACRAEGIGPQARTHAHISIFISIYAWLKISTYYVDLSLYLPIFLYGFIYTHINSIATSIMSPAFYLSSIYPSLFSTHSRGTNGLSSARLLPGAHGYSRALRGTQWVLTGTPGYSRVLPGTPGYSRVLRPHRQRVPILQARVDDERVAATGSRRLAVTIAVNRVLILLLLM